MNQENSNLKFRIPLTPNNITFTMDQGQIEVMRITSTGIWVNPEISVDEIGQAVLNAIDSQVKIMVQRAVEDEREACAKLVEADGLARGEYGYMLTKAAARILARGEK